MSFFLLTSFLTIIAIRFFFHSGLSSSFHCLRVPAFPNLILPEEGPIAREKMICLLTVCGLAAIILNAAVAGNLLPRDSRFLDFSAFPLPAADLFSVDNPEVESSTTLVVGAEPAGQLPCTSGNTGNKQQRVADGETMCPPNDGPTGERHTPDKDEIPDFAPSFGHVVKGVPVLFDEYKAKKCVSPRYPLHLCCDGPLGPWIDLYQHWLEVENCEEREFSYSVP